MQVFRASARARALALIALLCPSTPACRRHTAPEPARSASHQPILLVTIDTLRADRLGSYGSKRGLTPALDRFARDATLFAAAVSQAPLTLPSHATMLTGLHPARHGIRTNDGFTLGAEVPTLAEHLKSSGYRTGAFIGGYPLGRGSGLARGFDRYDDDFLSTPGAIERPADAVLQSALAWIEADRRERFFAWIHLFDPHSPYVPPEPFAAAHREAPYDGEIAYTDAVLGHFFDRLRQLDLYSSVTIIVVADHGESLGEHGERTHGTFLYDATIRVPLLIKLADSTDTGRVDTSSPYGRRRNSVVEAPVETADLAPTIAALAGTTLAAVDGLSLLPLLAGARGDPDRPAYAESYYQHILLGWSPLRAVRTARWKFIEAPHPELYDLEGDPGEQRNQAEARGALASALRRALTDRPSEELAPHPGDRRPAPAPESADRLRSLGYASGTTTATAATRAVDPKDRVAVWAAIEEGIDLSPRDPASAGEAFGRVLRLDPANGLAMKYLADLAFRAGRLRQARDGYRRAIDAGFRHPDAYVNLAAIAEREGALDGARAALGTALELAPSDADAWNRLGLIDARRGDLGAARHAFTRAIELARTRPEPYYNLGLIERRAGNEAAARGLLHDAIARNPAYAEAHFELATGYLAARQPERALEEYRVALTHRPGYAEALFGAARAELDLGRRDDARRDYERFVRVAPPEYRRQIDAARDAIRRLARK